MVDPVVVIDPGYDHYEVEQRHVTPFGAEVVVRPGPPEPRDVAGRIADAIGVLVRESPIDAAALAGAPRLRGIVRYGVGVDNIDLKAAASRGIKVANVPDYGVEDVSTQSLALLLAVNRRIVTRDAAVRRGAWNVARAEPMWRFTGKTLGLYGYGRIGASFHRKAAPLGFARTLVADPALTVAPPGADLADLATLLRESDVVACHAPLTASTRHVIGRAALATMKPTAILVNTGRGGIIDEDALAEALAAGRLFGAGIDVYEHEPPDRSHALFALPNAVLSDHTAWYSEESVADLQRKAAEEMARILGGGDPLNWVNRPRVAA